MKYLALGNTTLAIRDLLKDKDAATRIATYLAKHIRDNEIQATCSPGSLSSLRPYGSKDAFLGFNWANLYVDIQDTLPLLTTFIEQVLPLQQRVPFRNAICVVIGMLVRGNSNQMNLIQSLFSIVLYGGRTTASVSYISANLTPKLLLEHFLIYFQLDNPTMA